MFHDQKLTATIELGDSLNQEHRAEESFSRRPRVRYVVCGVLVLLAFSTILFYLKNSLDRSEDVINYDEYPFLRLTSPDDLDLDWKVWVDPPNNQVFLVKTLTPAAAVQTRRLLRSESDLTETTVTQVIHQKFNQDHMTIYHLFEGDSEHSQCFRYSLSQGSEFIPHLKISQFSEKTKTVLSDDGGSYELKSPESGLSVEVKTDSQGKLLKTKFRLYNDPNEKVDNMPNPVIPTYPYPQYPPSPTNPQPKPIRKPVPPPTPTPKNLLSSVVLEVEVKTDSQGKLVKTKFIDALFPYPVPSSKPKPTDPTKPGYYFPSSVVLEVTEPFDIERIKAKLLEAGQCSEYDQRNSSW